jgi:hypothetical protein
MSELRDEIAAYDSIRADLETKALGKWAVVHDKLLVGIFDNFESAAKEAVRKFGRGPYLIRQIGSASITLSAAAMYNTVHADHSLRV